MTYIYPAIFEREEHGVSISFPDLPGCLPCAEDFLRAFKNARECLSLHLYGMLKDGDEIPAPSRLEDVPLEKNEAPALIEVDLDGFKPDWSLEE